jgi:hypothetical protein
MVCDGVVPPSVLSYTTDEQSPVKANVWLAGAPPGADVVTVTLSSSNVALMKLSKTVLTFTQADYADQIEVLITPVNSDVADDDRTVHIITSVSSTAELYNNIAVPQIPVNIVDLQTAGVKFSQTKITAGAGRKCETMKLKSEPRAPVTVEFAIVQDSEGAYNYASVVIDPPLATYPGDWSDDWETEVPVCFNLADDGTYYGDVQFNISITFTSDGDPQYAGLKPDDITVTVLEGDPPPAWFVSDTTGLNRIVAAEGATPLAPPTVREGTAVLNYAIRPTGNLYKAGGVLRTSTRPTSTLLLLFRASYVSMCTHPWGY